MRGIPDFDPVGGESEPVPNPRLLPRPRNARVDAEAVPGLREAKDRLEPDAIHPARRPGVPGPAATPEVSGRGIDIRRHHERLDLVPRHILRRASVGQWVDHLIELGRAVTIAVQAG